MTRPLTNVYRIDDGRQLRDEEAAYRRAVAFEEFAAAQRREQRKHDAKVWLAAIAVALVLVLTGVAVAS